MINYRQRNAEKRESKIPKRTNTGLTKLSKAKNPVNKATGSKWSIGKDAVPRRKPEVILETDQQTVVNCVRSRKSVFFTGVAGTGKSFLINHLVSEILPKDSTFVTASTGIAAVNISGTTLASFAGVGDGSDSVADIVKRINNNPVQKKKWLDCRVLIIDEISMISGALFDKIEEVARAVRKSERPMGGILVIASGDFLQLPPVDKLNGLVNFAYEAKSWSKVFVNVVILTCVRRQNDSLFVTCLNEIREGKISDACVRLFTSCCNKRLDESDGVKPTLLYPTRKEVGDINDRELDALPGKEMNYTMIGTHIPGAKAVLDNLIKGFNGAAELKLKVNAQVMLIKNLNPSKGLVNGSRGVVTGFAPLRSNDDDSGSDLEEAGGKSPSPLTPKDDDSRDLDGKDDDGQKRKGSGSSSGEDEEGDSEELWPVVKFACGVVMTIGPEKWETKQKNKPIAKIEQVPLILGWALTIHKSQGMTLDKMEMSMDKIFEYAQAYVAFSRVKSIEGLSIKGTFDRHRIRAHPRSKDFYDDLKKARADNYSTSATPSYSIPVSQATSATPLSSFVCPPSTSSSVTSSFITSSFVPLAPLSLVAPSVSTFSVPPPSLPKKPVSSFAMEKKELPIKADDDDPLSDWDD